MKSFCNVEMERSLREHTKNDEVIASLMKELWRGHSLLVLYMLAGDECLAIRSQDEEYIPCFTSQNAAEAFLRTLPAQTAAAMHTQEETIESLMDKIVFGGNRDLILDLEGEHCAVIPKTVMQSLRMVTAQITGGRMPSEDLPMMRLHMNSLGNRRLVERSERCGCFRCIQSFPAGEIREYATERDGRETALCPRCGTDSVLTDQEPIPLTDELLEQMHARFFGGTRDGNGELKIVYMQCMRERAREETAGL